MELPPFHHQHHHPRYVPPPPPNFSDNSNFYQNQHHCLPPPPPPPPVPLPPPPAPPHRLSYPPPHLPTPSQSQFTFRAQLLDERQSPRIFNFMSSHRLNHQKPHPHPPSPPAVVSHYHHHNHRNVDLFDDNSRFSVPWSDLPTLPRNPPEPRLLHQNHHRPVSPFRLHYEGNPHDFDRSSRVRTEFIDEGFRDDVNPELPLWRRKDRDFDGHDDLNEHICNYHGGHAGYDLNFDRIHRDFAFTDLQSNKISLNPSRNLDFNGGNHELYNEDSKKDSRWGYSCLGKDSVYPMGVSVHSRESSERGRYDTGVRFNNNRVGEGAEELISRSPRKKPVQKKSALLRIQLGKVNNGRNRSRDQSHFLKGYHDESSSSGGGGGGSFKGKEKDVFLYSDSKMKGEREKSPVELDVSFKSNALVAKAIMATSSPVVDSNRNLTPRNSKLRKLRMSDSPGIKSCEDFIRTESSTDRQSGFNKDHGRLKDKVISDTTDRSKGGLASPFGLDKDGKELAENDSPVKSDSSAHGLGFPVGSDKDQTESAEKVITFETDSCIYGLDHPSGTEKDRGQLVKKARVSASVDASDCASQPCLSGAYAAGESSASKESPKLLSSDRGSKGVASSGTIEQSARKRKRDIIPFQRESVVPSKMGTCVLINQDNLSKDTPQFIQLDESVKGSEEGIASVETSFVNAVAAESLVDDVTHEKLKNGSQLLVSNSRKDKIHDQVDACISNNEACSASSSDQQFCRSESISTVFAVASKNASTEESIPTNETIKDSDDQISFVDSNCNLCSSKMKKTIDHEGSTIEDCSNVFSSATPCSAGGFADTLGLRTISESFLSDDTSKQTLDAATRLPESGPLERPSNAKMSGVDNFIDHCVVVHSPRIKSKREVGNDHLRVHDNNTSEIGDGTVCNTHCKDASVRCLQNFVSINKEVVPCDGDFISRDSLDKGSKGSLDEGPSEVHRTIGGKKRKVSIPRLASPTLSETCHSPKGANSSTISEKVPSDIEELTAQSECRIALSGPDDILPGSLNACSEPSSVDAVGWRTHQVASLGDGFIAGSSKLGRVTSCLPKRLADCKENASVDLSTDGHQISPAVDQMPHCGDGDCENFMPAKENIASLPSNLALSADVDCVSFNSSENRPIDTVPDASLNRSAVEEVLSIVVSDAQNNESMPRERANGHLRNDNVLSKKSGCDMSDSPKTSSFKSDTKEGDTVGLDLPLSTNTVLPLPHNAMKVTPNPLLEKSSLSNKHQKTSSVRGFPGQTSVKYPSTRKASPLNHLAQPRTWHRTGTLSTSVAGSKFHGNHVASQIHSQKEYGKVQNSYIRKGNSLVRKPSSVGVISKGLHVPFGSSICRLNPVVDDAEKDRGSRNGSESVDPPNSTTQGGIISGPERPKTPPLIGSVKMLSCTPPVPGVTTCLPSAASPSNDHPSEALDHSVSAENMDTEKCFKDGLKPFGVNECQTGSSNKLDRRSTVDERDSEKQIIYVKRKSNQLVAASNSGDLSLEGAEKTQALSSDAYYKRSKNQLIRTPLDDEVKQSAMIPLKSLNSQRKEAQKDTQASTKRQSGFSKRNSSLVWTLHGALSSKKDGNWGRSHRAKRATCWRNVTLGLSPALTISRRLLLSQKRDTIYKRSISGFSLRRLKVFSVGGRSLKWSKSLEKKSRKANEDAILAVVAAEKLEREQNGATFNPFKSRNYVPRERVFRIGSERYRMDPTRKTLQRISDEKPSYSDEQSEMSSKKFYVPRRLLIGNDEYIRIGNGNKLVRDPKKRTRVLANEKVRWSLHTARLRLARKKKYCQFFTRFGKCNKDDRKCPYVHDPSKIAVCTKFLNGSCSNPNCKLTHKVIPERMQDCSYFLQGLCSNESCPYRHVNVNPNSPICEGFLRGYCADGNECWKKHTYVCPVFEATGNCQQGDKCRLHHPERKKGTKRKNLSMKKNARGRYFGVGPIDIANSRTSVSKIISETGDDIFCQDGKFVDYISLDVSDEAIQQVEPRVDLSCDSEGPSDVLEPDLDELIKPIRIMKRSLNLDLSPAMDG